MPRRPPDEEPDGDPSVRRRAPKPAGGADRAGGGRPAPRRGGGKPRAGDEPPSREGPRPPGRGADQGRRGDGPAAGGAQYRRRFDPTAEGRRPGRPGGSSTGRGERGTDRQPEEPRRPGPPRGTGGSRGTGRPGQGRGATGRQEGGSRPDRPPERGRGDKPPPGPRELPAAGRGWGGLARKGTRNLGERKWEGADHADRPAPTPPESWEPEEWIEDRPAGDGPIPASRRRPPRPVPDHVAEELQKAAGARRAPRLAAKLADGVRAFERDQFEAARELLQPVADEAPESASVRELLGLTYYRLGRWRQAVRELEAYAELSRSTSAHAVLADANRALGRHRRVQELWDEIRLASEDPATVTEGRIVAAGSLADQGRIEDAIALLEKGRLSAKHPEDHHLRLWYALADLYERAGEVPRARDLFERVARHDPDLVDVVARRRALG